MGRHVGIIAAIWAVLTAVGMYWALTAEFNPHGYAMEAHIIDNAFRTMMIMAVPVFTFVVAALGYSIMRFRASGDPPPDGPHITGNRTITVSWLAVTSGLAAAVIINPGVVGMMELVHPPQTDVVVDVTSMRFAWRFRYPQYDITSSELVLPVNKRATFEVTATDVLHSFWIPAFRIKIDAVPGMTTTTSAMPMHTGDYTHDDQLRVQCAELCGLGHYLMKAPVRVVEQAEFEAWIKQQQANK